MSLNSLSPCDCSIIPMSADEADSVFISQDDRLESTIAKARRADSALCAGCYRVFDRENVGETGG